MFSVGDKIVYPMHGAGVINDIVDQKFGDRTIKYYDVTIACGSINLMIPTENKSDIKLRYICSESEANEILNKFADIEIDTEIPWNKRHKINMDKLRKGDLLNVSTVLKELMLRDITHGLSTGDRKMLILAKNILFNELAMALGQNSTDISDLIYNCIK